jgi:hypothetical protein
MVDQVNYARLIFGANARHVPAWLYVQDAGNGCVTFAGSSRTTEDPHPLRYGSRRTHQFIVGELIVRPHRIITTDTHVGEGLIGLLTGYHDIEAMLRAGETVL